MSWAYVISGLCCCGSCSDGPFSKLTLCLAWAMGIYAVTHYLAYDFSSTDYDQYLEMYQNDTLAERMKEIEVPSVVTEGLDILSGLKGMQEEVEEEFSLMWWVIWKVLFSSLAAGLGFLTGSYRSSGFDYLCLLWVFYVMQYMWSWFYMLSWLVGYYTLFLAKWHMYLCFAYTGFIRLFNRYNSMIESFMEAWASPAAIYLFPCLILRVISAFMGYQEMTTTEFLLWVLYSIVIPVACAVVKYTTIIVVVWIAGYLTTVDVESIRIEFERMKNRFTINYSEVESYALYMFFHILGLTAILLVFAGILWLWNYIFLAVPWTLQASFICWVTLTFAVPIWYRQEEINDESGIISNTLGVFISVLAFYYIFF